MCVDWGPLLDALRGVLSWLDGWIRTPGFGGAAAVFAAVLAFRAARRSAQVVERAGVEARLWDQAKWSADLIFSEEDRDITAGLFVLEMLLDESKDTQIYQFVQALATSLAEADELPPSGPGQGRMTEHPNDAVDSAPGSVADSTQSREGAEHDYKG